MYAHVPVIHRQPTCRVPFMCLQDTAVQLMLAMHQQHTAGNDNTDSSSSSSGSAGFWRSFYAALPPLGTVGGVYAIPPDYMPLIQEPAVVRNLPVHLSQHVLLARPHCCLLRVPNLLSATHSVE
jgi:anti-sigma-K factor RskA